MLKIAKNECPRLPGRSQDLNEPLRNIVQNSDDVDDDVIIMTLTSLL